MRSDKLQNVIDLLEI